MMRYSSLRTMGSFSSIPSSLPNNDEKNGDNLQQFDTSCNCTSAWCSTSFRRCPVFHIYWISPGFRFGFSHSLYMAIWWNFVTTNIFNVCKLCALGEKIVKIFILCLGSEPAEEGLFGLDGWFAEINLRSAEWWWEPIGKEVVEIFVFRTIFD